MYDQNSVLIAGILFLSMVLAIEAGYQLGGRSQGQVSESFKAHINAVQASLLGILALLLGFTFSLALQRFDRRSEAVVEEANAIGTAYLRAQLLPAAERGQAQQDLRDYLDLRVRAGALTLVDHAEREELLRQTIQAQNVLWRSARRAAEADPGPVTTGLYLQALNELIDSFGRRNAELDRHVPELVLFLLYGAFLVTGLIVGYSCGVDAHRPSFVTYLLVLLIVLLVFIVIDLDRPRRGLIAVSQKSLIELQLTLEAEPSPASRGQSPE